MQLIGDKDRRSSIKEVLISDPGPVKRVFHEYKKIPIRKVFETVLSYVISIMETRSNGSPKISKKC